MPTLKGIQDMWIADFKLGRVKDYTTVQGSDLRSQQNTEDFSGKKIGEDQCSTMIIDFESERDKGTSVYVMNEAGKTIDSLTANRI